MSNIDNLFENNRLWSEKITADDPTFFGELAKQQNPEYLWIGCSDSRVSADMLLGLRPGEIFVHRNIANLVNHTDINCLSVMQFAVEVLQVKHIIVCGHYGCGGIKAAMENQRHGLIDNWLRHIQDTINLNAHILEPIDDAKERSNRLCRLNVTAQVISVGETTVVQDAWGRGQQVEIHGVIYGLKDGLLRDLEISIDGEEALERLRSSYLFGDERRKAEPAS